jgi:hypothetical protein
MEERYIVVFSREDKIKVQPISEEYSAEDFYSLSDKVFDTEDEAVEYVAKRIVSCNLDFKETLLLKDLVAYEILVECLRNVFMGGL